jgi:hypothetical protein
VDLTKIREKHMRQRAGCWMTERRCRVLHKREQAVLGDRQAGASYNGCTPRLCDSSFTAFDSPGVVLRYHERHEEDSL